jgi:ATP-dependent HslUV protease ATP-binding subunit HslU
VEKKILKSLLGGEEDDATKKAMLLLYRDQALEDREVTIEVPATRKGQDGNLGNFLKPGTIGSTVDNNTITDMIVRIEKVMGPHFGKDGKGPTEHKRMKVGKARPLLEQMEMDKLLTEDHITKEAIKIAEEEGIIFIDEIDKIVTTSDARTGTEASSEGVQQDLLPIVEGSLVNTKLGQVNTNHMLFIASGAFHSVKPSDMLAELQGRLPIRVELTGLTKEDLYRILTEPDNNMVVQQKALLATEGVKLEMTDDAIMEIAEVASEVNRYVDNIGARRLHTVLERVLDEVSFDASEQGRLAREEGRECHIVIDKKDVQEKVGHLVEQTDLSRFIL